MAVLTTAMRKALPKSKFAVPSKAPGPGSYPMPDAKHAAVAKGRAKQFGSPAVQSAVRSKVKSLFGRKPSGDGQNGGSDNDGY